ncbi:FAD binding domain-containing protein [Spirochaeta isovalerica]|uniref:CO/xanthine dehydrogenase FAD-binding subunit n=1 Tax=Spirochaeta isovalerica TaxID=150 RepID=A0A841R9W6_9SPIO|nr:xanthine dehydrogenase family protein subunit M [Spirochaeta isovalerica]MBB6479498.1 CO/xanthine dehydrogenase FAD-binding subunit [Spirochaeta isovalerica]
MSESYRPETLDELLKLMAEKDLIPFAGGTDLMVQNAAPQLPKFKKDVVFLGHLSELKQIRKDGQDLIIGAAATLTDIENHPHTPVLLRDAVALIAAPALRNRGTMGGNICNASPAGDSIPPLYALDAKFRLQSLNGERIVKAEDFFKGPGRTDRKKEEILKEIIIPLKEWNVKKYRKVGTRAANALTKCSITAAAKVKGGRIDDISIAFGAVGPVIVRDRNLELNIKGLTMKEMKEKIPSILNDYSAIIVPIDDQRSTAEYRKQVCLNLLKDFLEQDMKG